MIYCRQLTDRLTLDKQRINNMLKFYASLLVMALIVVGFISYIGFGAVDSLAHALGG